MSSSGGLSGFWHGPLLLMLALALAAGGLRSCSRSSSGSTNRVWMHQQGGGSVHSPRALDRSLARGNRSRLSRASLLLSGSVSQSFQASFGPLRTAEHRMQEATQGQPRASRLCSKSCFRLIVFSRSVDSVDLTHLERAAKQHRFFPNQNRH